MSSSVIGVVNLCRNKFLPNGVFVLSNNSSSVILLE